MKNLITLILLTLLVFSCNRVDEKIWRAKVNDPQFLHRSVKQITDIIVHDIFSPPVAARIYTYVSVAGYEAALPGQSDYVTLANQLTDLGPSPQPEPGKVYSFELASVQAVLKVGRALIFSEEQLDKFYQQVMQEIRDTGIPEDVFENSIAYGDAIAAHVLAWSSKDNYKQTRSYPKFTIMDDEASWKPTPPAYMDAVEPHWNKIRPFAIDSAAQFKPIPPTPFSKDKKSQFYKEAMEVYDVVKNLTTEQIHIATFWDCNPFMMNVKGHVMFATKKISPGGHWINITRLACDMKDADFMKSIDAYTRVSLGLVDGFISCWDEKYRSKVIRPETYINQYIDEDWVPTLQTPPFPEYTSGHSVISNAAAVILTALFGDDFAFTDSTEEEFGIAARKFTSFYDAANEAAISRLYGGIHYRPAIEQGITEGRQLGEYILKRIKTNRQPVAHAD